MYYKTPEIVYMARPAETLCTQHAVGNFKFAALNYSRHAPHQAVIAHQIGHSAQKFDKRDKWARSINKRNLYASLLGPLFSTLYVLTRASKDKDFDASKLDKTDLAALGLPAGLSFLDNILSYNRIIPQQADASKKALYYLRSAKLGDLPGFKPAGTKYTANTKIFGKHQLRESKQLLDRALRTYKRGKWLNPALILTGLALPRLMASYNKKMQDSKGAKQSR